MRIEKDFLGEVELPDDALFGVNACRARENFPNTAPFHIEWYKAVGTVKKACYITANRFFSAAMAAIPSQQLKFRVIPASELEVMEKVAEEIEIGQHFTHFIVPAVQGGAGTSINMNVNEIITNRALQKLGLPHGNYERIDPVEHANLFQSTNDVIPTALRVAVLKLLVELESQINELRHALEHKEQECRNTLRVSYTQMQEAVPTSFGRLFSTYCDALSRDWWRVSKCFERIKTVNLGGSAIGSGITVPRYFIMEVTQVLQELTGLPLTRSENMHDNTANLDSFVEVHAILKAHAVNLEKMCNDLRLLASDFNHSNELKIPQKQIGSSIMPGKVNPVIVEYVISCSHSVYSNDMLISNLCGQGCLELNAYLPIIGHKLIESIKLLIGACQTIKTNLIDGLFVNDEAAYKKLIHSAGITTALLPLIGYNKATKLAKQMVANRWSIFEANAQEGFVDEQVLLQFMKPENLLKEGFSLKDLENI